MHFTRTPLKNKKPLKYGTNKMGQYYSNERVPIKNYNTSSIAARIDKNMTNLNVNEQATNKNLNQFIQPILNKEPIEPETDLNIFNYNYDNVHLEPGLAKKTQKFEEDYEEMKLTFNKNLTIHDNVFNYKFNTEINMTAALLEKVKNFEEMKLTLDLNTNTSINIFNYNYDGIIVNAGLAEKTKKFEEYYDEMKLTLNTNTNVNIFNYNYDSINVNVELVEKIHNFEDIKLTLDTDINVFNYSYSTEIDMNVNVGLTEKMELTLNKDNNSDIDIFNYNYDGIIVNSGLAEKTKKFEEEYEEMKLKLDKIDTNTNMILNTDDKNFNSFLSVLTEPDKNNDNNNIINDEEYINKPYTKSHITTILNILQLTNVTIENVYQETYGANINATGLGDFIRGSYFLMQFCEENELLFNINMLNHPISQFLEIYQNKQSLHYKNINKFDLTNFNPAILDDNILTNIHDYTINNDFMYFLKDQTVYNKKIYTYLISYPTILIVEEHKKYMRHLLKPTQYLSLLVNEQLTKLSLIEKEYTVIHVRYGDNYLIKHETDIKLNHLNTIEKTIDNLGSTNKILLVSDNMIIKNMLRTKYPHIKTHFNEITHTGEGIQLDTNKLKNTMIDFYLFSRAKNVFAFSVYKHGTGFSKWVTETYSVPYICRFLQ